MLRNREIHSLLRTSVRALTVFVLAVPIFNETGSSQNSDSLITVIFNSGSVAAIDASVRSLPKNLTKIDMSLLDVAVRLRKEGITRKSAFAHNISKRFGTNFLQIDDLAKMHVEIRLRSIDPSLIGQLGGDNTTHSDHTARLDTDHQHQKHTNLFNSPMLEESNTNLTLAQPLGTGHPRHIEICEFVHRLQSILACYSMPHAKRGPLRHLA